MSWPEAETGGHDREGKIQREQCDRRQNNCQQYPDENAFAQRSRSSRRATPPLKQSTGRAAYALRKYGHSCQCPAAVHTTRRPRGVGYSKWHLQAAAGTDRHHAVVQQVHKADIAIRAVVRRARFIENRYLMRNVQATFGTNCDEVLNTYPRQRVLASRTYSGRARIFRGLHTAIVTKTDPPTAPSVSVSG